MNMKIWEFWYNPMIHESGSITISLHKTKETAEKAMHLHRMDQKAKHDYVWKDDPDRDEFKFDEFKAWGVSERTVLD